jgi:hypothetical protein
LFNAIVESSPFEPPVLGGVLVRSLHRRLIPR